MDAKKEEWRDIVGYEGLYKVSNLGNVWSNYTNKNLRPQQFCGKKYYYYALTKDNVRKNERIHRLVAKAFIPNPNDLPEINHKDEDPSNNCVENLEWVSKKENCNYGTRNERVIKTKIEKGIIIPKVNKTNRGKAVICIETGVVYKNATEAHKLTGICLSSICKACNDYGYYHKAGNYHWRYKDDNTT